MFNPTLLNLRFILQHRSSQPMTKHYQKLRTPLSVGSGPAHGPRAEQEHLHPSVRGGDLQTPEAGGAGADPSQAWSYMCYVTGWTVVTTNTL